VGPLPGGGTLVSALVPTPAFEGTAQ
ncbi:MAG: hypothetical protein JWQ01_1780, partial [Massilia sp.]|nr:hypothetical protein [Massilia sp.]